MANQVLIVPDKIKVSGSTPQLEITAGTNTISAVADVLVVGGSNTVQQVDNIVVGDNNFRNNWGGITAGSGNTNGGQYASVFGVGNNFNSDCHYSLAAGYYNAGGSVGNYVFGTGNGAGGGGSNTINWNILCGTQNTLGNFSTNNAVFGQKNNVTGGNMNLVAGGNATSGHSVTGSNNIVGGGQGGANTVSGYNNCVLGWGSNVAGHDCFVNGQTNTVSGGGNSVVVGRNNVQSGGGNNIIGGYGNATAGSQNGIFGEANQANNYSLMYGRQNLCSADYSMAGGIHSHASNYAERALASGWWGSNLHAQTSELVLKVATTDAVATELSNPGGFLTIADNTAYTFVVTITAKDTASTDHASYRLKWSTVRGTGVATVTVDGLVKEIIFESQAAWDVAVTADTTNGRPSIKVTGETGKTIHWVARVEITETV